MITLDEITMAVGGRTLFEEVVCAFSPHNRYGLTGPNGAGKSTLLKIMMGIVTPVKGKVSKPNRVGMLRQNIHDFLSQSVINVVIQGNARLWDALQERDKLYDLEMTDEIGLRLGDLEAIVAEEDGYSAESNAQTLLLGIGVPEEYHNKLMKEIPQDMQFRALLCQALFGEPLALLLDEPTNHLDMESISWLETFLQNYTGTLIVVSHDRHFLNAVTTHIADIDYETVIIYPGNYDDMVEAKTAVRERAAQDAKSKEKKIAQLQEFISRFRSGTRASQVQSRMREMEKLQPQEQKKSNIQRPYIRFIQMEKPAGKVTLQIKSITKSYGSQQVIKPFSLEIHRGDKIGVIGNNGRGKTTLLKMLSQNLAPDHGTIELGHNVVISYFPQNHEDVINKRDSHNLFDWLKSQRPDAYDQDVRSVLGKMLFTGEDAFKHVSALSGGETARLIIGSMTLKDHNVIILDEPNNHLDLEAVSALGWALDEYPGTAIVASHDRDLIDRFAKKLIIFTDHGIELYDGPLEEYLKTKK
ncbi:MAG: ABC-F family ATP-binding cassette domain-containing protein [Verrucomicrobia bacterium]|nr:ABC-F family ATP-binding cassette domain-containing protein [Verrucomicrobiota bacterium]